MAYYKTIADRMHDAVHTGREAVFFDDEEDRTGPHEFTPEGLLAYFEVNADITTAAELAAGLAGKEPTITAGTTGQYWRGDKSWQTLDKTAVGLSNVDNTTDLGKPISTLTQTALDLKAPLASPTFTGTVAGITKNMVGLGNVDNTSNATERAATATLTNKSIDASNNTISNLATSMFAANVIDTDSTFAANSDTRIASQKAVKTAVDARVLSSAFSSASITPAWSGDSYEIGKYFNSVVVPLTLFGASTAGTRAANTTAFQTALDYCRDNGVSWYLPPGDYDTGPLINYTSGRCDGRFVIDNDPSYDYGMLTAPLDADVIDFDFTFVNSLTIERGNDKLAEFADYYGYSICIINYGDEVPIIRTGGTIRWIEPLIVCNPDGTFYPPFANTKTDATWSTALDARAVRIREAVVLDNVDFIVEDVGAGGMESVHCTERPNVIYRNCSIKSESSAEVLQAFIAQRAGNKIRYENCDVNGLMVNTTNYAWNFSACDITLVGCSESYCRRGQDGHGAKQVSIIGGSFPDGIGGHWIHGLRANSGAYISSSPSNTAPVHASGSDVVVDGCKIHLRSDQYALMNVRGDLSELRGSFKCINSDITIDCTANTSTDRKLMTIDMSPSAASHDWGRTIYMPDNIFFEGNSVWQKGASFSAHLTAISFLGGNAAAANPGGISGGGHMSVRGNSWKFDSSLTSSDTYPKIFFAMSKNGGAWNGGDGYKVVIEDLPCLWTFLFCKNDVVDITAQRSDFYLDHIGTLLWGANYGIFKEVKLGAKTYTNKIGSGRPSGGGTANTTAVGDENEIKTGDLYFPNKSWNSPSIADGAFASTTFTGCTGVTVGDVITARHRTATEAGYNMTAVCTTNAEIIVTLQNETGGTIDEGSALIDIFVRRT